MRQLLPWESPSGRARTPRTCRTQTSLCRRTWSGCNNRCSAARWRYGGQGTESVKYVYLLYTFRKRAFPIFFLLSWRQNATTINGQQLICVWFPNFMVHGVCFQSLLPFHFIFNDKFSAVLLLTFDPFIIKPFILKSAPQKWLIQSKTDMWIY